MVAGVHGSRGVKTVANKDIQLLNPCGVSSHVPDQLSSI